MTPEGKVKAWIRGRIKDRYPESYVYSTFVGQYGKKGLPDLIMCINGFFVSIEVKTETGSVTKIQEAEGAKIVKSGGFWVTIYGKNEVAIQSLFSAIDSRTRGMGQSS